MLQKLIFILFFIFFQTKNEINTIPGFINDTKIENPKTVVEQESKAAKLAKITSLLSVSIIGIFLLLTLALLRNINFRSKANKLLQEKNEELTLAKERAEKANQAKADFLSTITHELRTPLYAVTGLTHLLLEDNPSEEQKEHLSSLKFSGNYLLSLINNILDLNKLDAEKVEIEMATFDLKKGVSEVFKTLEKSAVKQKNKLNLEFDPSIPKKIIGDPLKISQILVNLIGNAIKFTTNGKIDVRVKKLQSSSKNTKLLFEVEDNGMGITDEHQQVIFDTFSQASLEINKQYGGTGLGLAIVKKLLELLGSEIKLESTPKKGSKFFFELDFETVDENPGSNKENANIEALLSKLKYKKALVVEDNKLNQMITCKILNKKNINTDTADDGETAITKCTENSYDFILMDIHMPGINGIEATKIIRESDTKTPIIALTAVTLSDQIEDFYNNGINEVIPKPYDINDFFKTIEKSFTSVSKMN